MDANEKNLNVAMNLLEGILAKAKFEKDGTKNYSIYFPVFDEEDGKILAKFPVFEIAGSEATLKGWQVYSLDDYRLDVFLMDNQNIVYDDYNTVNYRNPEDKDKLLYFINIFLKVQEFKKTGRGIDVVPENKALVEDLIGDFENNIVDNISEDVNRIYNYEIEYEDDDVDVEADDNTSILDSIDSLDDYEDNSDETLVPEVEEEEFEEIEEIEEFNDVDDVEEIEDESILPGMNFEDDDLAMFENTTDETEDVVEDEEDSFDDLAMFKTEDEETVEEFDDVEEVEDVDDENILPGMNFEDDDLAMFENTTDETEDVVEDEEDSFDDLAMFETEDEETVEEVEEVDDETMLPGMNFEDDDLAMFENTTNETEEVVEEIAEDEEDSFDDLAMFETEEDDTVEEFDETEEVEEIEEVDDEDDFEEIVDETEDAEETLLPGMGFDDEFLNKYNLDTQSEDDNNIEEALAEIENLESIIENNDEDEDEDEVDEIVDLSELEDEDELEESEEDETDDLDLDIDMDDEEEIDSMFESVVGMEEVKEKVLGFQKYVDFVKSMNIASADFNLAFVGNKGTGKSVIANIVTEMLYDMDMIAANKLTKVNRKELCACHHKGNVIDNVIEAAMGGVLLIDEVCRCEIDLGPVLTAKLAEAMDTGLVVIFSGCNEGMDEFLKVNKDIASKIAYRINFADYTAEDLSNIVISKAEFEGLNLNDDAKEEIKKLMKVFENAEGIDSRFTTKLFQRIIVKHANNSYESISISKEDIPTVNEMLDFVTANENVITAETVKAVYNSNVKLLVLEDGKVATLKVKANMLDTKSGLYNKLVGLVVGLAAEEVYFGEYTNNTEDLKEASCLAKYMVRNGMSEFGLIRLNKHDHEMESQVYEAANKLIAKALEDAKSYVNKNKKNLDNVIEYVNKNKTVTGEEIVKALEPKKEVKKETKEVKETKKAVKEVKETKPAKKVTKVEKTAKETKATKKAEPKTKATAKTTKTTTKKTAKK